MASDMFGAPAGILHAADYADTRATTQYKLSQIAMQPAIQRQEEANAGLLETKLAEEKAYANLMQVASRSDDGVGYAPDGKPGSFGSSFWRLASLASKAGLPNKAADLAKTASLIDSREAAARRSTALTTQTTLKTERDNMGLIGTLLDGVTDQAGWDRANMLFQFETGLPSPYSGMPYSSELVARVRRGAMTVKQQIDADLKKEEDASRQRAREGTTRHQRRIEELVADRTAAMREREARLAKAGGGKGVTTPAKSEIDQATRLIKGDFPKLGGSDYLNAAYEIASEARALRRQNPALDANQAISRAYLSAKQRGDFKEISEKAWIGATKRQIFTGAGRTAETAGEVPADPKELITNRYYRARDGRIGKWNGKGFDIVSGSASALSGDNTNEDDEDDTDDEGDDE